MSSIVLSSCIALSTGSRGQTLIAVVEVIGRLALLWVLLVVGLPELVLHSAIHECVHECRRSRQTWVLPSLLHLKRITEHRSDLEDAKPNPVEKIEAKAIEASVAHTELFEDEEALVFARVDARVERALESIADQRLDTSCVGETLVHRRVASDELSANKDFGKRKKLLVAASVNEQLADGWRVDGDRTSCAERHLAVADGETTARLLSNHQGESGFLSTKLAVHSKRMAYAGQGEPIRVTGELR